MSDQSQESRKELKEVSWVFTTNSNIFFTLKTRCLSPVLKNMYETSSLRRHRLLEENQFLYHLLILLDAVNTFEGGLCKRSGANKVFFYANSSNCYMI